MTTAIIASIVIGLILAVLVWILLDRRWRKPKPMGPLALCLDNSGSMHGRGVEWRNAFTEWMLRKCEVHQRTVTVFYFDHQVQAGGSYSLGRNVDQHQPPKFANGGTRYDEVLNMALATVGPGGSIVMLTDGMADTTKGWADEFNASRRSMGVDVHSLYLVDNGWHLDMERYLGPFSDHLSKVVPEMAAEQIADFTFARTTKERT